MKTANFKKTSVGLAMGIASLYGITTPSAAAMTLLESSGAMPFPQNAIGQQTTVANHAQAQTDRIIVKYRDGRVRSMSAEKGDVSLRTLSESLGTTVRHVRSLGPQTQVVALGESRSVDEVQAMASHIAQDANVLYAEPDLRVWPAAIPTDPRFNEQWHYFEPTGGINLPKAWDISTGDGVVVAVIDTGIRPHQDLDGNVLPGYDFVSDPAIANDGDGRDADPTDPGNWRSAGECGQGDPGQPSSWHGTHVAGTIAANTNNGIGVSGVAAGAYILPVRALGKCGGYLSDIAESMLWAAGFPVPGAPANPNPAKVLNLSLGGFGQCPRSYQEVIEAVRSTGATVVVSAGNENTDVSEVTPANCPGVVAVAATRRDGGRAYYSNYGSGTTVAAPGGQVVDNGFPTPQNGVLSTVNAGSTEPTSDDDYGFMQGTSMAAPHVAGVAALLYAIDGDLSADQVAAVLTQTARPFPTVEQRPCSAAECGAGIVDAAAAVRAVAEGRIGPDPVGNNFANSSDVAIPDYSFFGAISPIAVEREGDAGIVRIDVDIKHPAMSDLYVLLTAPNGARAVLEQFSGIGAAVPKSYRLQASGVPAAGNWRLWVVDLVSGNVGYINSWKITFE